MDTTKALMWDPCPSGSPKILMSARDILDNPYVALI